MAINYEDVLTMEWRRGRVSGKRQVTIPQKFFEQVGIKDEVEFSVKDQYIVIRPVRENKGIEDFSDMILEELIREGYEGEVLLSKFREKQAALRGAVENLVAESNEAARQYKSNGQTEEIFGDVMED